MAALFITGIGTDVGKTYVTASLVRALRAAGRAVDVLKPVVSGFDAGAPAGSDPSELLAAMGVAWSQDALEHISPWRYAAPVSPPQAARLEGRAIEAAAVIRFCRQRIAASAGRLLLIEGAGGVMSPLDDDLTMLDLAAALGAPTLLVAGSYLGAMSHTLTAVLALRSVGCAPVAVAVSETPGAPPLAATIRDLQRLLGELPVHAVPRGGSVPAALLTCVAAPAG